MSNETLQHLNTNTPDRQHPRPAATPGTTAPRSRRRDQPLPRTDPGRRRRAASVQLAGRARRVAVEIPTSVVDIICSHVSRDGCRRGNSHVACLSGPTTRVERPSCSLRASDGRVFSTNSTRSNPETSREQEFSVIVVSASRATSPLGVLITPKPAASSISCAAAMSGGLQPISTLVTSRISDRSAPRPRLATIGAAFGARTLTQPTRSLTVDILHHPDRQRVGLTRKRRGVEPRNLSVAFLPCSSVGLRHDPAPRKPVCHDL
jgi:hypothetical protein